MKILKALAGGLGGSVIITALHQLLKNNYSKAPRLDLLGEEALLKGFDKIGVEAPAEERLYNIAMVSDIALNTLFFSAAAVTVSSCSKGTLLGLLAGLGGLYLPEKMGLNPEHSNRTLPTKILTVGLYTIGGYAAGKIIDKIS
jgi:hypothetical protein